MRHVYAQGVKDEVTFAEKAAEHFAANPAHYSFTDGEVEPGALLALRWGGGNDCVLVLRIGDDTPVVYGNIIPNLEMPF